MAVEIYPVVMCGGSGTRLWPMSTKAKPKQFHNIVSELSMLQETIARSFKSGDLSVAAPSFVCASAHKDLIIEQCAAIGVDPHQIILEPMAKNTAAVAAAIGLNMMDDQTEKLVLLLPADHHILDVPKFWSHIQSGCKSALAGNIVTFGIQPTHPETGYGYILGGNESLDGSREIIEFVEKPDLPTAEQYIENGSYYWNAGIFLFRPQDMIDAFTAHAPDILASVKDSVSEGKTVGELIYLDPVEFDKCRSESFDYAIMEKSDNISLIGPIDIGWSDIGSWRAVYEFDQKTRGAVSETEGNAAKHTSQINCSNVLIKSSGQFVATVGVSDIAVIATSDAVLVINLGASQDVKKVVAELKKSGLNDLV